VHFPYEVSIPKSTSQSAPYEKILPLSYGVITGMLVIIPTGHAGKAHLQLFNHEFMIYPLSRGEDYHGDGVSIPWEDRYELFTEPFELKARGWNTDTANKHAFQVFVNVLLPEQIGMQNGTVGLTDLQEIVGTEIEV
jgi:hypothetical protein